MDRHEFRSIRQSLLLTQDELARLLGYAHKIRISEYERETNWVPVPDHIAAVMRRLSATGGRLRLREKPVRERFPRRVNIFA